MGTNPRVTERQSRWNARLDGAVRTEIGVLGRKVPAFQVCGGVGFILAMALAFALAWRLGLSAWIVLALAVCGVFTFLALAMAAKIVTGVERLVYYHHEIAVVADAAMVLVLLHRPLLPYLDITVLGLGIFLGCGRVGCFMVGCCHGRPHRWGVHYQAGHDDAGFTPDYVGVRLLPVQLLESLWVFIATFTGIALVCTGARPGVAFEWYVTAYSVGRFGFEFLRGDSERRYAWGFSEAQWTSLVLVCAITHFTVAAGMALTMAALSLARRREGAARDRLLHPRHLREMTGMLREFDQWADSSVHVGRTSLGVQVSVSRHSYARHYAISRPGKTLSEAAALALAEKIAQFDHAPEGARELVRGGHGVFHVLIPPRFGH